ncbi:MAG: glycosyltransferase family 4 protein [Beijerinckiaceae bacterium]
MTEPRRKLLFVATEDWFFCSHFLPMARAALAAGFDVAVACRVREHGQIIENLGCRVIPLEADRKSLNPLAIVGTFARMRRMMMQEKPDIVHLIALRSIIIGGLAARIAGIRRRVIALTGMGLLGVADTTKAKAARAVIRLFIRTVSDGKAARFLFENRSDPLLLGLKPDDQTKVTIVGGAGIDPAIFKPQQFPTGPGIRIALIARMLWSKGVDTAVEAIKLARAQGADVTLSLYGAPDPANPKAIPESTLQDWAKTPGIHWRGKIAQSDVPAVWAAHHLATLPSRGGEGLPRTLLEAAACGRAILTTDVPGCRDLVRNGIEGLVVPAGDPQALARAIMHMSINLEDIAQMGQAARQRVLDGHTEDAVGQSVVALYQSMLAAAPV